MNKAVLILALCLGLGAGLFWPLDQPDPARPVEATATDPTPPTEITVDQPPAADEPPDQKQPPKPQAAPVQPQTEPEPTPPPPAQNQPKAKAKVRVVKGQTPEEVLKIFRSSQTVARKITPPPPPKPNPPAPAVSAQPNIKAPKAKTKPNSKPVNGNYCYLVYGYEGWSTDIAFAVCMGESGGKPRAINRHDKHQDCSGSYGLFQIACFWAEPDDMLDPHQNIAKAYWLYQRSGWQPWGAYTNGSYRRHLP